MTAHAYLPTHVLVLDSGEEVHVMLDANEIGDGPAYTREEYEAFSNAAWSVFDGRWHRAGRYVTVTVTPLTRLTAPAVVNRLTLPTADAWLSAEYPDRVSLRADGSVIASFVQGQGRVYRSVAVFCRAWKAMVSLHPPVALAGTVDEIVFRHTGATFVLAKDGTSRVFDQPGLLAEFLLPKEPRSMADKLKTLYGWHGEVCEDHASFRLSSDNRDWTVAESYAARLDGFGAHPSSLPIDRWIHPDDAIPLRGGIDPLKVAVLAHSLRVHGWDGFPLVAEQLPYGAYVLWNGRHRLMAARRARLERIPLVLIDRVKWEAAHSPLGPYGAVFDTRDEVHRTLLLALSGDALACGILAHGLLKGTSL